MAYNTVLVGILIMYGLFGAFVFRKFEATERVSVSDGQSQKVICYAKVTDLSPAGLSTTTGHSCSSSKESIFVGCRKGSLKKKSSYDK